MALGATTKNENVYYRFHLNYKQEHGSFKGYPGAEEVTNEELLKLDCNILIPAALENVITKHNADRIKADIIAEGANGPTTTEADEILFERGIHHIPDILANAGGVTVSYYKWVQGLERDFWCEDGGVYSGGFPGSKSQVVERIVSVGKSFSMRTHVVSFLTF